MGGLAHLADLVIPETVHNQQAEQQGPGLPAGPPTVHETRHPRATA